MNANLASAENSLFFNLFDVIGFRFKNSLTKKHCNIYVTYSRYRKWTVLAKSSKIKLVVLNSISHV